MAETHVGAETLELRAAPTSAPSCGSAAAAEGPDVCIEAVGMEAHSRGPQHLYDQVKQQLRLETDRPTAVREAIYACRKGGSRCSSSGVFAGLVDKFPLGAVMNKGLTLRGAQQHGQRYIPMLLDRMARGELVTEHLATHTMPLDEAPSGYDMFKQKGRLRPGGLPAHQLTAVTALLSRPASRRVRDGSRKRRPGPSPRPPARSRSRRRRWPAS